MPLIRIQRADDGSGSATATTSGGSVPSGPTGGGEGRRGWFALTAVGTALLVLAVGVGWFMARSDDAQGVASGGEKAVVARVNGVPITAAAVDLELVLQGAMKAQTGQTLTDEPASLQAFKRDILDQLVDQQLMLQDAVARGIDLTAEQAEAELPQWAPGLDLARLEADVAAGGMTGADYREWGRRQVVLAHYLRDEAVQQLGVEQVKANGGQPRPAQSSDVAAALEADAEIVFRFAALDGAADAAEVPMAKVGHLAPDFTLRTPEGDDVALSDFRGRPVLLNFWATWCGPCKVEMPLYAHVYGKNRDKGLVILAVNVQETPDLVSAFKSQLGLEFPVALDESGQVSTLYRVRGLPTTVLISPEGVIVDAHRGAIVQREMLLDLIRKIMPEVGT